jgi:hypothetical protein
VSDERNASGGKPEILEEKGVYRDVGFLERMKCLGSDSNSRALMYKGKE